MRCAFVLDEIVGQWVVTRGAVDGVGSDAPVVTVDGYLPCPPSKSGCGMRRFSEVVMALALPLFGGSNGCDS